MEPNEEDQEDQDDQSDPPLDAMSDIRDRDLVDDDSPGAIPQLDEPPDEPVRFVHTSQPLRRVKYACSNRVVPNCNAVDHVKLFEHERQPFAINCWKCHAGFQMDPNDMVKRGIGMFPVAPSETEDGVPEATGQPA